MAESGQISRMWNRWKADAREDCFDTGAEALGMTNLITAWLMLGFLALMAAIITVAEYYVFKKIGSNQPQSSEKEESLKDSWNSDNSSNFYEKKHPASKSELAKEWFEFAFAHDSK